MSIAERDSKLCDNKSHSLELMEMALFLVGVESTDGPD